MKKYILLSGLAFILATSCSDFLDINDDPNNPTSGDFDQLLPSAQTTLGFALSTNANENGMIFSNAMYNLSESQYTQDPGIYDNDWNSIFGDGLSDIEVIITNATAEGDAGRGYLGIAQVLKGYVYGIAVDLWGDVPFSEALKGEAQIQPPVDDDAAVYAGALALLDQGIANLNDAITNGNVASNDLFYNGNFARWIKLANSVKLRMWLNMRFVDPTGATTAIEALASDLSQLIESNSENFAYQFGNTFNPENRHPIYQQEYTSDNKTFYMSNYFILEMLQRNDPRTPYFFYRQTNGSTLDFQTTPCAGRTDCPIGYLGDLNADWSGYVARDHGDPSGLPGDNTLRTTFAVYPIGGAYDAGDLVKVRDVGVRSDLSSNGGSGIAPLILASQVRFMLAEAALTLGTTGDPRTLLKEGIELSMSQISNFASGISSSYPSIDASDTTYVDSRLTAFDEAPSDFNKLDEIIKEKYTAQWGNGIEVFTDLRRTGMPLNRPASIAPAAPFPARIPYGKQEISTNPNIVPVPFDTPVFWDIN